MVNKILKILEQHTVLDENSQKVIKAGYPYIEILAMEIDDLLTTKKEFFVKCPDCRGSGAFFPDSAEDFSMECVTCKGLGKVYSHADFYCKNNDPEVYSAWEEECKNQCVNCKIKTDEGNSKTI